MIGSEITLGFGIALTLACFLGVQTTPSKRLILGMNTGFLLHPGDGQELSSIETVYGSERTSECPLLIGSVKSNLGHTEAASGLTGCIPTAVLHVG